MAQGDEIAQVVARAEAEAHATAAQLRILVPVMRELGVEECCGAIALTLGPAPSPTIPAPPPDPDAKPLTPEQLEHEARRAKYRRELGYTPSDAQLRMLP